METLRQDIRYALRGLRQRPLFTMIAVASIAIGIGANTAIFSVLNAVLLRPVAGVGAPERVVEIGRTNRGGGFDTFSFPELRDMQAEVPALDRVAGWRMAELSWSAHEGGQRVLGYAVSQPYFDVLGATPLRGRFFVPEEDRVRAESPVAVVSYRFWQRELGGDPGVVGRTIDLNRRSFTVIGVTRPEFRGHLPIVPADVFIPLTMFGVARPGFDMYGERRASWLMALGRLAPGATAADANAGLALLTERRGDEFPDLYRGDNARGARAGALAPLLGGMRKPVTMFLTLLLGLAGVVLLITCANVAGMLLARAAAREREVALRIALGSGRGRLVRTLLTESLVLFALGGTAGIALGYWGTSLLEAIRIPVPVALELELAPDLRVLGFGIGVALVTGLLFGLAPALQSTRPGVMGALKGDQTGRSPGASLLRRGFVVAEVGLSVLLLVSAGLFLRSLQRASAVAAGFEPDGAHMVMFDLSIDGYDEMRGRAFLAELTARLETMPGVKAAGAGSDLPLDLGINEMPVHPVGWSGDAHGFGTAFSTITPGFLDAAGTRVLRGRDLSAADRAGSAPVVLVSRRFAEQAWPQADAIGQRVAFDPEGRDQATVVGIVEDVKTQTLMEETVPMLYMPAAQRYDPRLTLLVRSSLPPALATRAMLETIRALDPRLSLAPVQSFAEYTGIGVLPQRVAALLASVLGAVALLLSALGVYGVIAYGVAQRTREIGVRMALGAARAQVAGMVVRGALLLTLPGVAAGGLLALGLARLLRGFILGVTPWDPLTFAVVPALLLTAVVLAAWVPARRAAGTDPMRALRAE